jgi:hypothetical protein
MVIGFSVVFAGDLMYLDTVKSGSWKPIECEKRCSATIYFAPIGHFFCKQKYQSH